MRCYILLAVVCLAWITVSANESVNKLKKVVDKLAWLTKHSAKKPTPTKPKKPVVEVHNGAMMSVIGELDGLIDTTINPCDDFQKYLCSKVTTDYHSVIYQQNAGLIKARVKQGRQAGDGEAVSKFFDFINKCKATINDLDETVKNMISRFDGLLKDEKTKKDKNFDAMQIAKVSAYLSTFFNIDFFMGSGIGKRHTPPTKQQQLHVFVVTPPKPILDDPKKYDQKVLPKYEKELKKKLRDALGLLNKNLLPSEDTITKLYNLDIEISKLFPSGNLVEAYKIVLETTITEAMKKYPEIDWKQYFTSLSKHSGVNILKGTNPDKFTFQIVLPNFIKSLSDVIKRTSIDTMKTYLKIRIVLKVNDVMEASAPNGCEKWALQTFPLTKQYLFINTLLPTAKAQTNIKNYVTKITNDVTQVLTSMMKNVSWIRNDNQTLAGLTNKIKNLKTVIAFPNEFTNKDWLNRQHASFKIAPGDTLEKLFYEAAKFTTQTALQPQKKADAEVKIIKPSARFDNTKGQFIIPLGLLNNIIYNPDFIPAITYGSLGSIIGHEFLHGFDAVGSNYDGDGYLNPWMSANSKKNFGNMAKCVIDEYSKFYINKGGKNYSVDGKLTSDSNIGDIAGLKAAYTVFKSNRTNVKPFPKSSKLKNLTQEQLFFLSFGRTLCAPRTTDATALRGSPRANLGWATPDFGTRKMFCAKNVGTPKGSPAVYCEVLKSSDSGDMPS